MKFKRIFGVLIATILAFTGVLTYQIPVAAAGSISLSNSSGQVGASITVTGTGFTPNKIYVIKFDTLTVASGQTSASGTIVMDFQVPKQARTATKPNIYVLTEEPYTSNSVLFNITPAIGISAASAFVGDTVTVYGQGFYGGSTITIYFDNAVVGTTTSDNNGGFDSGSFNIPSTFKGLHSVRCKDSADYSAPVGLTVSEKLTVSPISGGSADKVLLTGTGFAANNPVSFYFDDNLISGVSATTDLNGGFSIPNFSVPTGSKGSHVIKAQDTNNNAATTAFTITQKLSLSPAEAVGGTTVTVSGSGFKSNQPVAIKYNTIPVVTSPSPVMTNPTGGFSATFVVPAGNIGNYTVEVSDGTNTSSATFSAIATAKISQETTAAKPGYVGQDVTISGDGFKPNATVNVYFASETVLIGNGTCDGNGHFSVTVKIPSSVPGDHTITITDSSTIKTFPFYIEDKAPSTPKLLSPVPDAKQEALGQFTWESVSDPSGVTYNFQIARDQNFTNLIVDKKGVTFPNYTLTEPEKLPSNNSSSPYYWRVKAIDGTKLESAWTAPQTFNVGFVFELTGWILWVVIALGGILLFLMGFLLGRRLSVQQS